jgi:hypothetical protein
MTGYVTGAEAFVMASYVVSGITLICLAGWTRARLQSARRKLKMLEATTQGS